MLKEHELKEILARYEAASKAKITIINDECVISAIDMLRIISSNKDIPILVSEIRRLMPIRCNDIPISHSTKRSGA